MVRIQVSNDISIDSRSCHKTERLDSDSDRVSVHSHVIFRAYDDSYSCLENYYILYKKDQLHASRYCRGTDRFITRQE